MGREKWVACVQYVDKRPVVTAMMLTDARRMIDNVLDGERWVAIGH